jgi:hypothetical protein
MEVKKIKINVREIQKRKTKIKNYVREIQKEKQSKNKQK